jgi:hypothetical protein
MRDQKERETLKNIERIEDATSQKNLRENFQMAYLSVLYVCVRSPSTRCSDVGSLSYVTSELTNWPVTIWSRNVSTLARHDILLPELWSSRNAMSFDTNVLMFIHDFV